MVTYSSDLFLDIFCADTNHQMLWDLFFMHGIFSSFIVFVLINLASTNTHGNALFMYRALYFPLCTFILYFSCFFLFFIDWNQNQAMNYPCFVLVKGLP